MNAATPLSSRATEFTTRLTETSTAVSSPVATTSPTTSSTDATGSATSLTSEYATTTSTTVSSSSSSQPSASFSSTSTSTIPSGTVRPTSDKALNNNDSGNKYGTGALAGSIVGSFLGGFIIAFLVAFLLLRRRKDRNSHPEKRGSSTPETYVSPGGSDKSHKRDPDFLVSARYEGISYASPNAVTSKSFDLSPYVPEPADDTTVCTRIQTFFDQASLHVDNYYARPDPASRQQEEDIAHIGDYDSAFLGTPLVNLLSRPRTQRTVLTHTLVHTLLQGIRPENHPRSLLPASYSLNLDSRADLSPISGIADKRALFAWRMLTSYLQIRAQHSPSTDLAVHNEIIAKIAGDFNRTFAPYGDPRFTEADRLAHLHTIVREASRLGVWLFSQPCSFEFHWSMPTKTGNQITLLPSVIKVCDEQGSHLVVPQTVLDETKAQI